MLGRLRAEEALHALLPPRSDPPCGRAFARRCRSRAPTRPRTSRTASVGVSPRRPIARATGKAERVAPTLRRVRPALGASSRPFAISLAPRCRGGEVSGAAAPEGFHTGNLRASWASTERRKVPYRSCRSYSRYGSQGLWRGLGSRGSNLVINNPVPVRNKAGRTNGLIELPSPDPYAALAPKTANFPAIVSPPTRRKYFDEVCRGFWRYWVPIPNSRGLQRYHPDASSGSMPKRVLTSGMRSSCQVIP